MTNGMCQKIVRLFWNLKIVRLNCWKFVCKLMWFTNDERLFEHFPCSRESLFSYIYFWPFILIPLRRPPFLLRKINSTTNFPGEKCSSFIYPNMLDDRPKVQRGRRTSCNSNSALGVRYVQASFNNLDLRITETTSYDKRQTLPEVRRGSHFSINLLWIVAEPFPASVIRT